METNKYQKHIKIVFSTTLFLLGLVACTENKTINQTSPPVSQAGGQTRTSDPDGWGGGSTGDGGGGQGVLCSEETKDGNLRGKLMVRDVYEAQYNYRRTMVTQGLGPAGTESVEQKTVGFLLSALKRYYGPALRDTEIGDVKYWTEFAQKIAFVPEQAALYPSNDANSPLALPKGCRIVQIAYWDESAGLDAEGTLYVDKTLWVKLDQFNKAALLAHEYFFKKAREAGLTNSDYTRYKVGQLLSMEGMSPLFPGWVPSKDSRVSEVLPESPKGYKSCVGSAGERGSSIRLYQYRDNKGVQRIVIPSLKSGNYSLLPFQSVTMSFQPGPGDVMGLITDQFLFNPDEEMPLDFKQNSITGKLTAENHGLESFRREFYTINVPAKNRTVKLSVINPMADIVSEEKTELKPSNELALQMNLQIEDEIKNAFGSYKYSSRNLLEPIAALNAEIDLAVKQGIFPQSFPKWNAELDKIEHVAKITYTPEQRTKLYSTFPDILYRIKLGTYSDYQISKVMGIKGYKKFNNKVRTLVQFNLTVDDKKLDYGIGCSDYSRVYREITQRADLGFSEEGLDHSLAVSVIRPQGEAQGTSVEAKYAEQIKTALVNGSLRDATFRNSFFAFNDDECFVPGKQLTDNCRPAVEFLEDLKNEKSIQIKSCQEVTGEIAKIDTEKGLITTCMLFDFNSRQQKYIAKVVFKNPNVSSDVRAGVDPNMPFIDVLERLPYFIAK